MDCFQQLGYESQAEIINALLFLPQRRQRAWCVFIRKDLCSNEDAFRLCRAKLGPRLGLCSFLDASNPAVTIKRSIAALPTVQPKSRSQPLKWPIHTAAFVKAKGLNAKVLKICLARLRKQPAFHSLNAREQRLLVCHYAWAWQRCKPLAITRPEKENMQALQQSPKIFREKYGIKRHEEPFRLPLDKHATLSVSCALPCLV